MVPKFKDRILFREHLFEAAKKRVLDAPYLDFTDKQIQQLTLNIIRNTNALNSIPLAHSFPINSASERQFLKNFKYFTHLMNSKIITLEELLEKDSIESSANIKEIQRELVALDTEVEEKEIELLGNYSQVHLNTFSRTKDSQLQYSDKSWLIDFKTGITYREKYMMNPAGPGSMTNPIRSYKKVAIKDAVIIDELSDTGDSVAPLQRSNPRNIFRPSKIFRYVVARKEFDSSSRRYKTQTSFESYPYSCTSTLTVQLELPNLMQVNTLKIDPLGDSTVFIKDIRYISESAEEISLATVSINAQTDIIILFEPIITKYIIVQFEQKAHVERTEIVGSDQRVRAINSKLEAKGFVNRLPEIQESVKGRVYDFSLENMEVGLSVYETKGIFRALPIKVSSPAGMEMQKSAENIVPTTSLEKDYFGSYSALSDEASLLESYVGVKLWDRQENKRVDSLIPVLDSGLTQREILAPISEIARFKLFPDMSFNKNLVCIEELYSADACLEDFEEYSAPSYSTSRGSIELDSGSTATFINDVDREVEAEIAEKVTLSDLLGTDISKTEKQARGGSEVCTKVKVMIITLNKTHNLSVGDEVLTVSEESSASAKKLVVFEVVDDYTIKTNYLSSIESYWLSTSDPEICIDAPVNLDFIKVYENNTLLRFGTDYEISIDAGSTWKNTLFKGLEVLELVKPRAGAGRFYIKLLNYDPAKYYWTEYTVERNQYLSKCKNIKLKNGRVVFDRSLKYTTGTFQSVIISRTNSNNSYLTPVVREYSLAIQARDIDVSSSGKVIKSKLSQRKAGSLNAS